MLLTLFFLAVFAIIGLQLFMGQLKFRCIKQPDLGNASNHSLWWDKKPDEIAQLDDYVRNQMTEFINDDGNWVPDGDDPIICATPKTP